MLDQSNLKGFPRRRDGGWIVPLVILRTPVVEIDCFSEEVVTGIKAAPISVELVRKDKLVSLVGVVDIALEIDIVGSISMDEPCP